MQLNVKCPPKAGIYFSRIFIHRVKIFINMSCLKKSLGCILLIENKLLN